MATSSCRDRLTACSDCGVSIMARPCWLKLQQRMQHAWQVSDLDHLKVFLACAALRADPIGRNVLPARAGSNPFFRKAGFLIIYPSTNQAHPRSHLVTR